MSQQKTLLNIKTLKFEIILKNNLPKNFLWFNSFHVSTQTAIIQNRIPEPVHATVKYFTEI